MKNTTSMPMLHLGIKEETPLKKNYLAPNITMVEFSVEVGTGGSFKITSINNREEFIDTESDGTEQYEADQDRNFF